MASALLYICLICLPFVARSHPVPKRVVDMTHVFDETTLRWPTVTEYKMTLLMNATQPQGFWLQLEDISTGTHAGTHMDAPAHFVEGGMTIDQIPVENLIGPAAVIDIIDKAELDSDAEVQIEDLTNWENETGLSLNGTIVMIKSGWGRRWSNQTAFFGTSQTEFDSVTAGGLHFPGLSPRAAQWLVDRRRILGLGTETLSFDRGSTTDFRAHRIILGANIWALENVANMEEIPTCGAMLYVMPMKLADAGGAPTRIVATFPDTTYIRPSGFHEVIVFN